MRLEYFKYVSKMKKFPHSAAYSNSKYLELLDDLSNNKTLLDNKKRFFKHPIKTIKSIFII